MSGNIDEYGLCSFEKCKIYQISVFRRWIISLGYMSGFVFLFLWEDNTSVTAVTHTIASMIDLFGDYEELISISSRVVADGAARSDLETAFERGSAQYQAYVRQPHL